MLKSHNVLHLLERIGDIGEINIPILLLKHGSYEEWTLRESILNSSGASARIPSACSLISLLEEFDLVCFKPNKKKGVFELTIIGREFSELPYQERDRLSKERGEYLLVNVIAKHRIINEIGLVLKLFNFDSVQWKLSCKDTRINSLEEQIVRLLQQLRMADYNNGELRIREKDYTLLAGIVRKRNGLTEEDLLEILEQQRVNGVMAEEFVKLVEENRLHELGRSDLAKLVERVSLRDVGVGYDIASFNDRRSGLRHDRFIEVKGHAGGKISFFITKNELKFAESIGNNYWIYCVLNINSEKTRKLVMFRNPFTDLKEVNFNIEPVVWNVKWSANEPRFEE